MKHFKSSAFLILTTLTFTLRNEPVQSQQINWTHFRGNNLNGISSDQHVPVSWNDSTHIIWKTAIQGKGWSSPVVYGEQIWVTSASEDGKHMAGICLDFNSGKLLYHINLFEPETTYPKHSINTYATPTPCIEDGFVYLNFGTYGTACVDTKDGKVVWKRTDLHCDHVQGPGSSPILYKDLLILHIEGVDVQYLVALNKLTGETVWRADRPAEVYELMPPIGRKSYITPIIMNVNGQDLLISNGSGVCIAYNPLTGEEIWRIVEGDDSTIAMPFSEDGLVYFYPGFVSDTSGGNYAELLAVNPEGQGDITRTNIVWRLRSPILQLLTPVIKDGLIYTVDTRNMLYCLDAKTGQEVYSKRLKQKYNSSPVYAAGNIYFTSVKGETMVLKAGNQLQILAENKLPGEVYATPAFLRNSILMRTDSHLYRIGTK
jgi:outer membrane protein assembly factor BamB